MSVYTPRANDKQTIHASKAKNDVYGAVIMALPLWEFIWLMDAEQRWAATDLWTKPISLSHKSAYNDSYSTTFIITIQYCSVRKLILILSSHAG